MKPLKHTILILSLLFLLSGSGFFTINTSASGTSQPPVYYVRFSGTGLGIYADPSLAGEPMVVLPDGTYVQLLSGPVDSLARIRICGTGLEGYAYDTASGRTKSSYAGYLARWKANARGTDLNKNFVTGFGSDAKTLLPSYAGYPGAAPFTEPETLSLGAVTLLCRPSVIINYHSMGEVAYWDTRESLYTGINTEFSSYMLSLVPYKRMGSGTASGSYLDWIYSGDNPVCSITFETGNAECPFTFEQYPKIWLQHSLVMQAALEYAYIH